MMLKASPEAFDQTNFMPFSCVFCRSLLAGDSKRWTGLSLKHRLQAGSYNPTQPKLARRGGPPSGHRTHRE
jgi:hypothetical protein